MWTAWWCKRKHQEITKVIWMHHLGIMVICIQFSVMHLVVVEAFSVNQSGGPSNNATDWPCTLRWWTSKEIFSSTSVSPQHVQMANIPLPICHQKSTGKKEMGLMEGTNHHSSAHPAMTQRKLAEISLKGQSKITRIIAFCSQKSIPAWFSNPMVLRGKKSSGP